MLPMINYSRCCLKIRLAVFTQYACLGYEISLLPKNLALASYATAG